MWPQENGYGTLSAYRLDGVTDQTEIASESEQGDLEETLPV